jgi:hypothetical protein
MRLVLLLVVACGPPEGPPPPGKLTLKLAPAALATANLTLSSADMHIDRIMPIGNVPPPHMPPPPPMLDVDASSTMGASFTFDMLPPGLYSRVQLSVEGVMVMGSWRGTPLTARLGMFGGGMVDVRSATGADVEPSTNATLTVTIDPNQWFAGNLLDGAMTMNGQIVCDMMSNGPITGELNRRVTASFALP